MAAYTGKASLDEGDPQGLQIPRLVRVAEGVDRKIMAVTEGVVAEIATGLNVDVEDLGKFLALLGFRSVAEGARLTVFFMGGTGDQSFCMTGRTKAILSCFTPLSITSEQVGPVFIGVHVVTAETYDLVGQGTFSQGQPDLQEFAGIIGGGHSHRMKVGRRVTLETK
jgi:hypothetical protein